MVLFIILGAIVLIAFIVSGVLFFMLDKEEQERLTFEPTVSLSAQAVQVPSDETKQLIETLTKENGSFKNQQVHLEQAQQKLGELQEEFSRLRTENLSLQTQLESAHAKVRLLEEEISRAHATVSSASEPQPDEALRHELESLKYELVKAKAQSSGLERVSFNYKNQLEEFFKKVNTAQVSNDHLSQAKNRLEGMVQEIKSQNEELVKKDQLAQFELEKNRSRLTSLEREYEDLKARVQQNNSQ
jgi:chromosome segregation ATPase